MIIKLPYSADINIINNNNNVIIEIEDSYNQGINALLNSYNNSNGFAELETIEDFFDLHEDQLQEWLSLRGYIFNKA